MLPAGPVPLKERTSRGHHTPDLELLLDADDDVLMLRIRRLEPDSDLALNIFTPQAPAGELSVYDGYDDAAMGWRDCAVDQWRIATDAPTYTAEDMCGKGAAAKGARWNSPSEHVTYTATNIALAAWETRAHLGRAVTRLPFNRYLVRVDVPDDLWAIRVQTPPPLPVGWNVVPEGVVSRSVGSTWLKSGASALYVVPSVIVEEESNVLINPAHPDAAKLVAAKVRQFSTTPASDAPT